MARKLYTHLLLPGYLISFLLVGGIAFLMLSSYSFGPWKAGALATYNITRQLGWSSASKETVAEPLGSCLIENAHINLSLSPQHGNVVQLQINQFAGPTVYKKVFFVSESEQQLKTEIDVSFLPPGSYIVRVYANAQHMIRIFSIP